MQHEHAPLVVAGLSLAAGLLITARLRRRADATLAAEKSEFERQLAIERNAAELAGEQLGAARRRGRRGELSNAETMG